MSTHGNSFIIVRKCDKGGCHPDGNRCAPIAEQLLSLVHALCPGHMFIFSKRQPSDLWEGTINHFPWVTIFSNTRGNILINAYMVTWMMLRAESRGEKEVRNNCFLIILVNVLLMVFIMTPKFFSMLLKLLCYYESSYIPERTKRECWFEPLIHGVFAVYILLFLFPEDSDKTDFIWP